MIAGAAAMGLAMPAVAQENDQVSQVSDIVVTGSRIARQDYKSSSPIVTVSAEDFQATGAVTIDSLMNDMPQFTPSVSSTSNNPSNGGQANLDLRSLGSKRTLVLMNGRRLVPSNSDGSVDVNLIPTALIKSVETISGGASAAYGSDAVAGVANFIINDSFEGVQIDAQYGQTDRNDGETESYSLTIGGNFADDKGNAVISINRSTRSMIYNAARDFAAISGGSGTTPLGSTTFDANNLPSDALFKQYFNSQDAKNTGAIGYNVDGTLFAHQGALGFKSPGGIEYDGFHVPGSNYVFNTGALNYLQLPLERWNVYSSARYKVNDNAEFYGNALFNQYVADQELAATPASSNTGFRVPSTNPFIGADLRALLDSRANPNSSFQLSKRFTDLGGRHASYDYNVYQVTGGIRGQVPQSSWTYDVYASFGRVSANETQTGNVSRSSVQTLLDDPWGGAGNGVDEATMLCEGGFNPFGLAPISASCLNYIGRTSRTATTVEQNVVEGTLQGKAFDLPAGEVRVAMGVQYRENSYRFDTDPSLGKENPKVPHLGADGLPDGGMIGGDEIAGFNPSPSVNGSVNSIDLFGEALVPLLSNLPFIQQLDMTLGYRYSDYSSIGGTQAYRADLDWTIIDGLRLRGGYNRAVRAPSVGELYSPLGTNYMAIGQANASAPGGDPCDSNGFYMKGPNYAQVKQLCIAQGIANPDNFVYVDNQVAGKEGGNPGLSEETADTWSFGVVYQPRFESALLSNMSFAIDYYSIEIEDVISSISAADMLKGCFNGAGENPTYDPNNSYCQMFERNPLNGAIFNATSNLENLGVLKTAGIDAQFDWRFDLVDLGAPDWGTLNFNAVVSWLAEREDSVVAGGEFTDRKGTISDDFGNTFPEWKSLASVDWAKGPFSATARWRRVGEMTIYGSDEKLDATHYFDLMGSWAINDTVSLRAGVNNVGDQQPRVWDPGVQANTDPSTYDVLGRRYFVGLTARF
ncbi:TonB-dependent receptor domain-containing protein [Brevundimonas diminuta]|jgi:iron complex outermembrane receptor protein|uniref:TonB-dependent receptor domain-containing protein n=2 Tax=Brevundimonas diminuta TaxID=293 RepID=UPI000EE70582|nr:TonB-dependent receptor [Brevundimonas diminuta]